MLTNFKRQLWLSLSIIFGSIIFAVVILNYIAGDISVKADKIVADRSLINEQADSLNALSNLKEEAPQAVTYQAAMDNLLPTQDGLIGFGQWMNGLAATHQVTANVLFQGTVTPPSGNAPGQAGFSLDVTGAPEDIAAFLSDAESKASGFLMQITSSNLVDRGSSYDLSAQGILFFKP